MKHYPVPSTNNIETESGEVIATFADFDTCKKVCEFLNKESEFDYATKRFQDMIKQDNRFRAIGRTRR